jgi:hypothetical protein
LLLVWLNSLAQNMDAVYSSEMSVNFYQATCYVSLQRKSLLSLSLSV